MSLCRDKIVERPFQGRGSKANPTLWRDKPTVLLFILTIFLSFLYLSYPCGDLFCRDLIYQARANSDSLSSGCSANQTPAFAQNTVDFQSQDTFAQALKSAELYMQDGQFQKVIEILEPLCAKHLDDKNYSPDSQVFSYLKQAYRQTKSYDRLTKLILEQINTNPKDWLLWCEWGDCQIKMGELTSSEQSFGKAIQLVPDLADVYPVVANYYLLNGMTQNAIQTYITGNRNLKSRNFSLELAHLYESVRDYKKAVESYFDFMQNDSEKFNLVQGYILGLISSGEDLAGMELALRNIIQKEPENKYAFQLLSSLLFEKGEVGSALEMSKTTDLLWQKEGEYFFSFARLCQKNGFYPEAISACDYLLSKYPYRPFIPQTKLCKAASLEGEKKYSEAASSLQKIIFDYKRGEEVNEAYFQLGEMKLSLFHQPDSALFYYRYLLKNSSSLRFFDAVTRIGDCFLIEGELDSAYLWFTNILKTPEGKDKFEEVRFKLAEIDFFRGKFDQAEEEYNRLVLDYPKGLYVNNCLEKLVLLKENKANSATLLLFSEALLERTKRNYDKALSLFQNIINFENKSQDAFAQLAEASQVQTALIYRERKAFGQSIEAFSQVVEKYPKSFYCPLALKSIGDIYYFDLDDKANAEISYERVLSQYNNSPFVEEIRDKLKRIKEAKKG
jgi:tetratricopeptide (TPR) repeat protein